MRYEVADSLTLSSGMRYEISHLSYKTIINKPNKHLIMIRNTASFYLIPDDSVKLSATSNLKPQTSNLMTALSCQLPQ